MNPRTSDPERRPLKLLIATDGSHNALRAVQYAAGLARRGVPLEVALLNVQPPVMSGEVGVVAPIEIAERKRTLAAGHVMEVAREALDAAGVAVTVHETEGDPAEEIARMASELACDGIVVGRRGLGALASLVLGSVSAHVVRLAKVPVTLVH